jgi:hypothetical protein
MIHIYFKSQPLRDRYIYGDRYILQLLRLIIRGKRISGIEKVFINLCKSFDEIGVAYQKNKKFKELKKDDKVIVFGLGKKVLEGYFQKNKIIAGIALVSHPSEWPTLVQDYPIAKYLQHSEWAREIYVPYYGNDICETWFAGIETKKWSPRLKSKKTIDFLIYNKIQSKYDQELIIPIKAHLAELGYNFKEITYGSYKENGYVKLLSSCKAMIFLSAHESQGFAYQEAMSMDVPILAWNQGFWLDPNLAKWNNNQPISASSVPFFDDNCGETFTNFIEFKNKLNIFLSKLKEKKYQPRHYVLKNLTLAKSGERMLEIINNVYGLPNINDKKCV